MSQHDLYLNARLYGRVFPLDAEELAFWRTLAAGGRAPGGAPERAAGLLLDLGAGPSALADHLGDGRAVATVALDPCRPLLAASPARRRLQADAASLPLRAACAAAAVSRLFGLAYAAAVDPARRLPRLASELGRVLAPGGVAALEIPLAWRPGRLQGLEETAEIAPGILYRFRYFALETQHELGAVLGTRITVEGEADCWELETPLFVFTPDGARRWAATAGLGDVRFFAPYDLETETPTPPPDTLRGILHGRKENGPL